jgi:phage terminase large subunit-like protein
MAEAAMELLAPARWAEARAAAVARAHDFAAERIVPQYERLYDRVTGR